MWGECEIREVDDGEVLQAGRLFFFFQAEDGIRDAQESRGLGDVYKRQCHRCQQLLRDMRRVVPSSARFEVHTDDSFLPLAACLLYTSDAADDLLCVDLGGRRIIKKKQHLPQTHLTTH